MVDDWQIRAALAYVDNPPIVVVLPENWEAARAAQLLPDHIDSFKNFQDWYKNLNRLTTEGK